MSKGKTILLTIVVTIILLVTFFIQGAAVVMGGLQGTESALVRGGIIWGLVIITLIVFLIKDKNLRGLGFNKVTPGASKKALFYIPLILIALMPFVAGFDFGDGASFFFANLFFTLSIGMAEEMYFRGIICRMWLPQGVWPAVIISAVLFGCCHLLNIAGGASIVSTVLQIVFAFVYGVVIALIFVRSGSIIPCVLLHALHDFCSFISGDATTTLNIVLGAIQFAILAGYMIYMIMVQKGKSTIE